MALRAEGYALVAIAGLFPAMLKELRSPTNKTSLMRRIGFSLLPVVRAPVMIVMYMFGAPRRLFGFRNNRTQLSESKTEST